jgi:endoribonuclease Dicer
MSDIPSPPPEDVVQETDDQTEFEDVGEAEEQMKDDDQAQKAPAAKNRKQDMKFQEWLEKNQKEVLKASKADMDSRLERLDKISVEKLLRGSSERIIASAREYQIDLFERAKNENTIVVLDTGMATRLSIS